MNKGLPSEIAAIKELTVNGRIYPVIEANQGPLYIALIFNE